MLQNICVRVIANIGTLRNCNRFRPWLAVLARREAVKYRTSQVRNTVSHEVKSAESLCDINCKNPVENAEQNEQFRLINNTLRELLEKYREALILKYSKDMNYGTISKILDVPITIVQTRLVRARRILLGRLSGKTINKVPRT